MNILSLLSSREFVSGESLARSLGISRAAVHKRIGRLREREYRIAGEKNRGYKLISSPDLLLPDEITSRMKSTAGSRWRFVYEAETDSTQTTAKRLAAEPELKDTVVLAERQTGGYGRFQRQWTASRGGIWCSLLLRPAVMPEQVHLITFLISLCVCRAVEHVSGVASLIKWPNDIIAGGKKLAGILTEMSAEIGRVNWVVAGIGINVNNTLPAALEKDAVTLKKAAGRPIGRAALLAAFLDEWDRSFPLFAEHGFGPFREEYCRRSWLTESSVSVRSGQETVTGTVKGIDEDGALLVGLSNGGTRRIIAGTILKNSRT